MSAPESRILLIETSGRVGSAGLATGEAVVAARVLPGRMRHAGELLPTIQEMLADRGWPTASLSDVYLSIGPGSFTGLRIAVSVARTLAWAVGTRVVAVPTVDVLALNALAAVPVPPHVGVVLDAKRSQVYAACFAIGDGECRKRIDAHLASPAEFLARCPRPLALLGEGLDYHREALTGAEVIWLDRTLWWPQVEHVFRVGRAMAARGEFTPYRELMPLYIRRPEAEEKWEQRHRIASG